MRYLLAAPILFLYLLLSGCLQGPSSSSAARAADESYQDRVPSMPSDCPIAEEDPMPYCIDILKCAMKCTKDFPFEDPQDFENRCRALRGCSQAQIDDQAADMAAFDLCMSLPANEVVNYP